ncbi:ATPase [Labrys miyagiensis]|uniref:ATPase n=1 Tax=Labrys miyagiensis TaxID=346912 RepID=A0ABQ6CIL4_9HYPH|nr:SRPBCC family protein [Labrys miyagiensis]GLS19462.1 ATPase [Labrys miyagiensis]
MTNPAGNSFVYVTYIRTTPEKLWTALTDAEFNKKFWFGTHQESSWKPGSPWRLVFEDGRTADAGEILEVEAHKRLVIRWRNEFRPELRDEGYSRCTMELEPLEDAVKLTITHGLEGPGEKFVEAVSGGWPKILSNLKSLLETGEVAFRQAYPANANPHASTDIPARS